MSKSLQPFENEYDDDSERDAAVSQSQEQLKVIERLRAQVQTLTQDVSHWKHEAERFKEALTLARQDVKRMSKLKGLYEAHLDDVRCSGQHGPDTSGLHPVLCEPCGQTVWKKAFAEKESPRG